MSTYDKDQQKLLDRTPNPAIDYEALPDFDTDLEPPAKGVRCATAGDVVLKRISGDNVTIPAVLAGEYLPFAFKQIVSTGTTETTKTNFIVYR